VIITKVLEQPAASIFKEEEYDLLFYLEGNRSTTQIYHTTQHHSLDDNNLHSHHLEQSKPHKAHKVEIIREVPHEGM
jgi:hypothetical protein